MWAEEFIEELVAAERFGADGDDGLQEFLDGGGVFAGDFDGDSAGTEGGYDGTERSTFCLQLELTRFQ